MSQAVRRNTRCTQVQKEYMISFMTRHRGLGLSSFSHNMGHQRHMELWDQLGQELSELGPSKTVEQWKTTWRDLKSRAKLANAAGYRARRKTNDKKNLPVVSVGDAAILSIIGKTSSERLHSVPECVLGDGVPEIVEGTAFATSSDTEYILRCGHEKPMPNLHENFTSGPSALTSRPSSTEEKVPLPTADKNQTRPSPRRPFRTKGRFTRTIKKDLSQIYESCSILAVLTEISDHMAERNEVERERNIILEKKNYLLERLLTQRFGPEESVMIEDE